MSFSGWHHIRVIDSSTLLYMVQPLLLVQGCLAWGSTRTVLGPSLFLVYINCVSLVPVSEGSKIPMYADDILLSKLIDHILDYSLAGMSWKRLTATTIWADHINHICSKARKLVGMLSRQFYIWADTSTLLRIRSLWTVPLSFCDKTYYRKILYIYSQTVTKT